MTTPTTYDEIKKRLADLPKEHWKQGHFDLEAMTARAEKAEFDLASATEGWTACETSMLLAEARAEKAERERDENKALAERLKLEAQIHSCAREDACPMIRHQKEE